MTPEVAEPKLAHAARASEVVRPRSRRRSGSRAGCAWTTPDPKLWAAAAEGWKRLGAEMVMLYPMYRMPELDEQIETLRRFKEVLGG